MTAIYEITYLTPYLYDNDDKALIHFATRTKLLKLTEKEHADITKNKTMIMKGIKTLNADGLTIKASARWWDEYSQEYIKVKSWESVECERPILMIKKIADCETEKSEILEK